MGEPALPPASGGRCDCFLERGMLRAELWGCRFCCCQGLFLPAGGAAARCVGLAARAAACAAACTAVWLYSTSPSDILTPTMPAALHGSLHLRLVHAVRFTQGSICKLHMQPTMAVLCLQLDSAVRHICTQTYLQG